MPKIARNEIIYAHEGDELLKVKVVHTDLVIKNFTWLRNGKEINKEDNIYNIACNESHTITFTKVRRYLAGTYSLEACIHCHEKHDPDGCFTGTFILKVTCTLNLHL